MGLPVFICWNLAKNKTNKTLASLSWIATIIVTLFMFTSGIMAAQTYNPVAIYTRDHGLSISDYRNFAMMKKLSLRTCTTLHSPTPFSPLSWGGHAVSIFSLPPPTNDRGSRTKFKISREKNQMISIKIKLRFDPIGPLLPNLLILITLEIVAT